MDAAAMGGRDASLDAQGTTDGATAADAALDAQVSLPDAAGACPSECLRAYRCAASCGEAAVDYGCCPCPEGTVDLATCRLDGACTTGCTGARPDDEVVAACQSFSDAVSCGNYRSQGFPLRCSWELAGAPRTCNVP